MRKVVIKTVVYEKETRTRRAQFVFEPSVYDEFKRNCLKDRISANERIHRLVEADNEARRGKVK